MIVSMAAGPVARSRWVVGVVRACLVSPSSFLSLCREVRRTWRAQTRRTVQSRWRARLPAERVHDHVELGLELRDSDELDAQFLFSIGKSLVYGPERCRGGVASSRARS